MVIEANFSQFLILFWGINARPIFNLLPFLRIWDEGASFEVQNFLVSPKRLKLEKLAALTFEDLWYLKYNFQQLNLDENQIDKRFKNVLSKNFFFDNFDFRFLYFVEGK